MVDHYKMAKNFTVVITDNELTFERKLEQIEAEALLDGIYVLRTDLKLEALDATSTVSASQAWLTSSAPFAASRP